SFTSFDVLGEKISQNMLTIKQGEYIVSAYGYGITPEVPFTIITERELVERGTKAMQTGGDEVE
ncbi:MAG: hypothetical protein LBL56_00110, partial [Treponema sp.]|nr:hypothetical protein [Treponema sp.]